ncbi:MAG: hypothetical protein INR71_02625 [Terriglobus roseus]|nr:hypothetical protein [Terriglobus roseus]
MPSLSLSRLHQKPPTLTRQQLPQQFGAAEKGGVPLAVILGEDELAAGKVKIKRMGLDPGHPEKDGVMVDKAGLVAEVRETLARIDGEAAASNGLDGVAEQLGGASL